MKGLWRATNYYNRLEAWKGWNAIASQHPDIAARCAPPADAGWRTIDKAIARVRAEAANHGSAVVEHALSQEMEDDGR